MKPTESRPDPKRLAVFGAYSDHDLYQRNRILAAIFEELSDATIYLRPRGKSSGHHFSAGRGILSRMSGLIRDAFSLWSQRSRLYDCDVIFVPYPAYLELLLLWIVGCVGSRFIVADAFLELHSTVVDDRKLIPPGSLRARLLTALQRFSLAKADVVLIDTPEQAALLRHELRDTGVEVVDVPVGIDENLWKPQPFRPRDQTLELLFWGTFIPLHGVEVIISAVKRLQGSGAPVNLTLIGDGQTAPDVAKYLEKNPLRGLTWHRKLVSSDTILSFSERSHIILGVFADSKKSSSVVPYKVHQALALNRPVITRKTELLKPLEDISKGFYLVPPEDPGALATAIMDINDSLERGWSAQTRDIYEGNFSTTLVKARIQAFLFR